ncbi:MAG: nucleoside hydrolase [Acidimicrobiales bacterium]
MAAESTRRQIIVDSDGACDDAIALLMCLADERVDLRAVTTVAGAVPVDIATSNLLAVLEQAGASHVPVYQGAQRPLARDLETSQQILGPRGMGDAAPLLPTTSPQSLDAVAALVDLSKELAGETSVLVALGPLTNLAAAIELDPDFLARFDEILVMGTATDGVGNITDNAEFNTWVDPEAAEVVFATPAAMTVVGWQACRTSSLLSTALHNRIVERPTPFGTFVVETTSKLREFSAAVGVDGYDLADGLAMAIVLDPSLIATTVKGSITIDGEQRGQTHLLASEPGRADVVVVETADAERFAALITDQAVAGG